MRLRLLLVGMAVVLLNACASARESQPSTPKSQSVESGSTITSDFGGVQCPSRDPLTAARFFLTAINDGDQSGSAACVHPNADRGPDSLFQQPNWASVARAVDAQLNDEFLRFADTYSFGSPDDPTPSDQGGPQYWIDPNGRLDVTVKLQSDGLYWVTRLSIEFHG